MKAKKDSIVWRGHTLNWKADEWRADELDDCGHIIRSGWMITVKEMSGGYFAHIYIANVRREAVGMTPVEAIENAALQHVTCVATVANLLGKWGQVPLEKV
jgi:hypothetical protein